MELLVFVGCVLLVIAYLVAWSESEIESGGCMSMFALAVATFVSGVLFLTFLANDLGKWG